MNKLKCQHIYGLYYNVNLVDVSYDGIEATYTINRNPNDILTYTKIDLLLCPIGGMFERLKVDTPETLKYRRKNYYIGRNMKKCEKITGKSYLYADKWWINKNHIIAFPYFIGLWVKTKLSNLWGYLSAKNLAVLSIILTVALAFLGIVATFFVGIVFR